MLYKILDVISLREHVFGQLLLIWESNFWCGSLQFEFYSGRSKITEPVKLLSCLTDIHTHTTKWLHYLIELSHRHTHTAQLGHTLQNDWTVSHTYTKTKRQNKYASILQRSKMTELFCACTSILHTCKITELSYWPEPRDRTSMHKLPYRCTSSCHTNTHWEHTKVLV